jgi:methylated-DNA-[protein]-cysteine S-methyltransferase
MAPAATTWYTTVPSPLGELLLSATGDGLTGLFMRTRRGLPAVDRWRRDDDRFAAARAQLAAYFAGELRAFDLPLAPRGTPFQLRVWQGLRGLPYGATVSYGRLAERIGSPGGARAVGLANGRNPISIVVPCHRVIGADGTLTGYGGGLDRKRWLLALEAATVAPDGPVQLRLPGQPVRARNVSVL